MPTSRVNLDTDIYVRINTSLNPLILQAHRDDVRITISNERPVKNNTVFHLLSGDDQPFHLDTIDTNVWALATTDNSSLIVSEMLDFRGDYLIRVARGLIPGHRVLHKFGHGSVGTTPAPVTSSGFWRTPTVAAALEFISDNINDTAGGSGATKIVIQGINEDWNETSEEIETDGTTAVQLTTNLIRLHRWYVSESGTYADETNVSHAGTLTIRVSGGGDVWDLIPGDSPFPGQSEIGVITVPTGYTAYILSKNIFTDTNKLADVYMMQRPFADDVTTPYTGARRIIERDIGVSGAYGVNYSAPKGPFVGPCDIGFMAKVTSGTADVSVDFEILIIQDGY